jgi:glycosyltransferase involved in cell wall biosynthesis
MHRSGTSALAGLLVERGYACPPDTMPAHPDDNPDGYYESREVVAINNRFLRAIGSHWKDPGAIGTQLFEGDAGEQARREIAAFLDGISQPFLVLKDPRLSRLLPLWLPLLRNGFDLVLVTRIVRHPDEVYASLNRRSCDPALAPASIESPLHSDVLWWRYNLEAIVHSRGLDSTIFSYADLVARPDRARAALASLPGPAPAASPGPAIEIAPRRPGRTTEAPPGRPPSWQCFVDFYARAFVEGLGAAEQELALRAGDLRVPNGSWPGDLSAGEAEILAAGIVKELSASVPMPLPQQAAAPARRPMQPGGRRHLLFISHDPGSKGHIYRVKNPLDALHRAGIGADWVAAGTELPDSALQRYSCVLIFRCPWTEQLERTVSLCRQLAIPVGYDIDDYLFNPGLIGTGSIDFIDRLAPTARLGWEARLLSVRRAALAADFLVTPTETLARLARTELRKPAITVPNCFSPENLALAECRLGRTGPRDDLVHVGYASGTPTHDGDFRSIHGVMEGLLVEEPGLRLRIVGHLNLDFSNPLAMARVERRPVVRHISLAEELAAFQVNLAPLQSNPFCDAKSPLKYFEAALVGVPTVATDNPTFGDIIDHGRDGMLARDPRDWRDAVLSLAHDPGMRARLASRAREKALAIFPIDDHVTTYAKLADKAH